MKYIAQPDGRYAAIEESSEAYTALTALPSGKAPVFLADTDAKVKAYLSTPAPTPQVVTMRQGKEALIRQGKIAGVQAAIDGIKDATEKAVTQNFWDNSNSFERKNNTLIALATTLGMSAADLDALFVYAATL